MTKNKYYQHPQYGTTYGEQTKTPIGRIAWPSLIKPKDAPQPQPGQQPGQPRYEGSLVIAKGGEGVGDFLEALKIMTDEMVEQFNTGKKAKISGCKIISDGDEFDQEKYPYYANSWVLTARNAQMPKFVNKDRQPIEAADFKGGSKVRFVITPLITAHGISYKLEAAQLVADDGTRFGGGARDATDLLEALSDDSEVTETKQPVAPVAAKKGGKGKEAAVNLLA